MGKIVNRRKAGVFLTLGITFLSLLVLSLATLILRNAEDSDERLMELSGYDRFYNIDRAVSDAYRMYDVDVSGMHLFANDTHISIRKFTDGSEDREIVYSVFAKIFFGFYLNTLYNSTTVHTLPQAGDFGLTFERHKSNQNIYYRYMYINTSGAGVSGGIVNGSWMHMLSFNESSCVLGTLPCNRGAIDTIEVIYQSNLSKFLNISAFRRARCTLGGTGCGRVKFRLRVINNTGGNLCVPPFDRPPDSRCDTWEDMVVSGDTSVADFLKNIIFVENAASNNEFKPAIMLGNITSTYYYNPLGTFLAVGVGNTTATVSININVSGPEKMRVFDVGEAKINLDLGKKMRVTTWSSDKDPNVLAIKNALYPGVGFPIRIL